MPENTELRYTAEHEWVLVEGSVATIGITAYAAAQLGDIVYLDLPDAGTEVAGGSIVGEIESTKSVGELFSPISGEVVAVNDAVTAAPETVNTDPTGTGWLLKVRFTELPDLLDKAAYDALTGAA